MTSYWVSYAIGNAIKGSLNPQEARMLVNERFGASR